MTKQEELKQRIIDIMVKEAILMAADQVQNVIPPEEWDAMPTEDRQEIIRYLAEAYAQGALSGAQDASKAKRMRREEQQPGKE